MSHVPDGLKYTENHEWVRVKDDCVEIGITDYAQEALGEIVFVELPTEGDEIIRGDSFGAVESTKSVSDIYAPVSGKIIEVNTSLSESPEMINKDPYKNGWIIKLTMNDEDELNELLTYTSYIGLIESEMDK